jgi:hypothetical protein
MSFCERDNETPVPKKCRIFFISYVKMCIKYDCAPQSQLADYDCLYLSVFSAEAVHTWEGTDSTLLS